MVIQSFLSPGHYSVQRLTTTDIGLPDTSASVQVNTAFCETSVFVFLFDHISFFTADVFVLGVYRVSVW